MSRMSVVPFAGIGVLTTLATGCSGTGPSDGQQLTVSAMASVGAASATAASDSITLGGHTLVFDKVELVLTEVELERQNHDDCDDSSGISGSDDDCEELDLGPLLVDLPLGGTPERIITVTADSGVYDEVEFKVHKPEDDDGDATFLAANPSFRGVSIRVTARYDGQPVVFTTDLDAEQEHHLVPPLTLTETTATNLTLTIDLSRWFVVNGQLVSPELGLKGRQFESQIKENIKVSFEMFKDRDCDGRDDDHGDD